ncbi:MAG: zinc ABC transporter permease subunit ZnuB [Gammaproteobacteria bacterium]|nr:zinc ABC transporter permease subunit ZnuB [Gammaproteobacteria bacterium]MDP2139709.1 zinc ABC transporter permease subunit ZnuB [Gammaproteobacteria bacterium]MDP2348912.1 zinc ABC transporter permease subunit ZnuB [Gammaproteobacteria bacterium]
MADFVLRALVAGICIALVAGPLGSFVVWRRMSYFGDTLAHSSLLGIALGILMDINLQLAVISSSIIFALVLIFLQTRKTLSTDTLLGILAHSTLAIGLLILSLSSTVQINLVAYLFGDLLTIGSSDLYWIIAGTAVIGLLLLRFWNTFLTITVHEELAEVEGVAVRKFHALMVLMIALLIAVSMKIVGVLLITSLLIIPPAAARRFASTPEQMALGASITGCLSVGIGLLMSYQWDTPAGPSVVATACVFFLIAYLSPALLRSGRKP